MDERFQDQSVTLRLTKESLGDMQVVPISLFVIDNPCNRHFLGPIDRIGN